jgi:hypothetical protein
MSDVVLNMQEPETRRFYVYAVWRGQVRMEKAGLKNRGGSVRLRAAQHLGLKRNASHDEVIAELTKRIDACKVAHDARTTNITGSN